MRCACACQMVLYRFLLPLLCGGFCDSLLDVSFVVAAATAAASAAVQKKKHIETEQELLELKYTEWKHCALTAMNVSDLFYDLLRILIVRNIHTLCPRRHYSAASACHCVTLANRPGLLDSAHWHPSLRAGRGRTKHLKISTQSSVKLVWILNLKQSSGIGVWFCAFYLFFSIMVSGS